MNDDNVTASIEGHSIEMELLEVLATKYHFSFNLIYGGDDWGKEVEGGGWTGAIGQVVANVSEAYKKV